MASNTQRDDDDDDDDEESEANDEGEAEAEKRHPSWHLFVEVNVPPN
jgi:hypothetical protein